MIKKFLLLSSAVLSTSFSFTSQAQDPNKFYETRICNDCSYSQAKVIATKIKPVLECTTPDSFRPDEEECWAKTNKVVVFNATTLTSYGFYNGYDNQGRPIYEMNHYVRDITNLPKEADIVLNEVVDTYKVMADIAQQLTQVNTLQSQSTLQAYGAQTSYESSCENSAASKTLKQSFSGIEATAVRQAAQSAYDNGGYFKDTYVMKRITGANFQAGLGSLGFGGTWEYVAETHSVIHKHYDRNSLPGGNADNQVGYTLSMPSTGTIRVSLNEDNTLIGGHSLSTLKSFVISGGDLAPCVGEALDEYLPKVVAPLGTPPSGGNTGPSGGGVPNFEGIPITSGGGYGPSTCTHHYYDRNSGAHLFSFEGPCP
jgi:hypothetical protein